jgi:acylglycerol lipase
MNHISKYFTNNRNENLFYQYWEESSKSYDTIAIIIHGLCYHSGCYQDLVNNLTSDKYKVYSLDLPGFGKSDGEQGSIDDFNKYYDDLESFRRLIKGAEGYREIIFIGHSLGANVAIGYNIRYPENKLRTILASPVISSPLFKTAKNNNSKVHIPDDYFSSLNGRIEVLKKDKLILKSISARLLFLLNEETEKVKDYNFNGNKFLFLAGEADKISPQKEVKDFFTGLECDNKQIQTYPRMMHDVFSEKRSEQVFERMKSWVSETKFEYNVK